jgi:hypothetical protein
MADRAAAVLRVIFLNIIELLFDDLGDVTGDVIATSNTSPAFVVEVVMR